MCDGLVLGRPCRIPEAKGHRPPDCGEIYLVSLSWGSWAEPVRSRLAGAVVIVRHSRMYVCVCNLVFVFPLHAARRAMAAVVAFT